MMADEGYAKLRAKSKRQRQAYRDLQRAYNELLRQHQEHMVDYRAKDRQVTELRKMLNERDLQRWARKYSEWRWRRRLARRLRRESEP